MLVSYCDTQTAALMLRHNGTTSQDLLNNYKRLGHFCNVAPLVKDNGELAWRLSLIEAIAKEMLDVKGVS